MNIILVLVLFKLKHRAVYVEQRSVCTDFLLVLQPYLSLKAGKVCRELKSVDRLDLPAFIILGLIPPTAAAYRDSELMMC